MEIKIPGHVYELRHLDGNGVTVLDFVKRIGDKYPYNQPPAVEGTTTQEVLRALINRTKYVDNQSPAFENKIVLEHLRDALHILECRAARLGGYELGVYARSRIEYLPVCNEHQHIQCGKCKE